MRSRALLVWICIAASTAVALPAEAAPPVESDPAAAVSEKVSKLFDEAIAHLEASRWKEAESAFQQAFDLKASYDIAGNLGDCELRLGQARDAAEHLRFALRDFPPTGKTALRKQIQARFDEAKKEVGAVRLRVSASGAEILVDGRSVGRSPLEDAIFVEPGARRIEARLAGYETARAVIQVVKGEPQEAMLSLVPASEDGPSMPLVLSGGIAGGVLLAVGIGLVVAANGKVDDAEQLKGALVAKNGQCRPPTDFSAECELLRSSFESADALTDAAKGTLIAGGLLAVGTAVYGLWPREKRDETGGAWVRVGPSIGSGSGGVVVRGGW